MPEVLKEMPKVKRPGRSPKYHLNDYFNQDKPIRLTHGTEQEVKDGKADFDCSVRTMRHNLYRLSKKEGINIDTATEDIDGRETIVFKRRDKTSKK